MISFTSTTSKCGESFRYSERTRSMIWPACLASLAISNMPPLACFRCIRLIAIKKSRAGFSVCHCRANWLLDVVCKRGGQFTQRVHAIYVSKVCLKPFGAFAILDVGRVTVPLDDLASAIPERHGGSTNQRYCPSTARRKRTSLSKG